MKKAILATVMAVSMCLAFSGAVCAQSSGGEGRPEMRGGRGGPGDAAALTEAQKETITSILSNYDAASLTAADAKAIHRAFRDAGVRPCPGFREAIELAGFDPDKLRELDPPSGRRGGGKGAGQGMQQDSQ